MMERGGIMDDDAKQWELLRQQVKEMREAMAVGSAATLRHENRIKEHQQWLEDLTRAWVRHQEFIAQHEAVMARIEENIQKITELILGGHTKNGH
jgi:hypothetical protein